jgi:hypothetical protein
VLVEAISAPIWQDCFFAALLVTTGFIYTVLCKTNILDDCNWLDFIPNSIYWVLEAGRDLPPEYLMS